MPGAVPVAGDGPEQCQCDWMYFFTSTAHGFAGRASAAASGKLVAGSGSKPARGLSSGGGSPPVAVPLRPLTAAEAAQRCSSQARGSIYDSAAGICCHFCRQVQEVTADVPCEASPAASMTTLSVRRLFYCSSSVLSRIILAPTRFQKHARVSMYLATCCRRSCAVKQAAHAAPTETQMPTALVCLLLLSAGICCC
jgi:hypothetical protein